jgi:hypothetical protein
MPRHRYDPPRVVEEVVMLFVADSGGLTSGERNAGSNRLADADRIRWSPPSVGRHRMGAHLSKFSVLRAQRIACRSLNRISRIGWIVAMHCDQTRKIPPPITATGFSIHQVGAAGFEPGQRPSLPALPSSATLLRASVRRHRRAALVQRLVSACESECSRLECISRSFSDLEQTAFGNFFHE